MKALLLFLFLSEAAFAQTYPRYKWVQSVEAYELYEKLDAAADSIYAVLQDLNDGYGANEPQHLRVPKRPDTDYQARWGAILPKDNLDFG